METIFYFAKFLDLWGKFYSVSIFVFSEHVVSIFT